MATVADLIHVLEILVPDPEDRKREFVQADHDILYLPVTTPEKPEDYDGWQWDRDGLLQDGRAIAIEEYGERTIKLKDNEWCHWSDEFDCWTMHA